MQKEIKWTNRSITNAMVDTYIEINQIEQLKKICVVTGDKVNFKRYAKEIETRNKIIQNYNRMKLDLVN